MQAGDGSYGAPVHYEFTTKCVERTMNKTIEAEHKMAAVVERGQGRPLIVLGNEVTLKLTRRETAGAYFLFEVVSPPGAGVPRHVHRHEDELIYVQDGELDVHLDGRDYRVGAGGLIHFPRFKPHAFRNGSNEPVRTLWTVIPGAGFERFFEELAALPADGPPDLEKVGAIFHKYDIEILES